MKIAILGSGGREHALAWKLSQDIGQSNIYSLPGNAGTPNNIKINVNSFSAIKDFCISNNINLIVVGPETFLANGIADYFFTSSKIKVFGPNQSAARLESSKIWAKQFMKKYQIVTPDFQICNNWEDAKKFAYTWAGNVVIKYDGLAAGKGVYVCNNINSTISVISDIKSQFGNTSQFIIENKLFGFELSIIGITDGFSIKLFPASQDHKKLLDNDNGPNTGGMGAIAPFNACTKNLLLEIDKKIIEPTLKGLISERITYHGVLYFGIIVTPDGPFLLEYNVRFGDPEIQSILPIMQGNLAEIMVLCINEQLKNYSKLIKWNNKYCSVVVLASRDYPLKSNSKFPVTYPNELESNEIIFHAGTDIFKNQIITAGGRILNAVGYSDSLRKAVDISYKLCSKIKFEGMQYRKDVGALAMVLKNYV